MSEKTALARTSTLLFCPAVGIWQLGNELYFDRKFYDGVLASITHWPGSFRLAIRLATSSPPKFGLVQFIADEFPAKVSVLGADELIDSDLLGGVDIVLGPGDSFNDFHLADLCRRRGIKCVYGIEYTLATRIQIAAIDGSNIWRKLKSILWLMLKERERLQAFRKSDGLQANGVPAYDAYASLVPNALLYFDSRITAAMGITDEELSTRLSYLDEQAPLRLGFSGRLISVKGADQLVEIALQLKKRQVHFSFDIFGAGELVPKMQEKIEEYGLSSIVRLRGVADFTNELVPFIKSNLDLFVCCHRQSDPSCTYLETYACGVPIIGYNNRAHQGILARHDVGWSVAMNDVEGLAELIARLNNQRDEIKTKARNAVRFAREHTFEATFQRRISQCIQILSQDRGSSTHSGNTASALVEQPPDRFVSVYMDQAVREYERFCRPREEDGFSCRFRRGRMTSSYSFWLTEQDSPNQLVKLCRKMVVFRCGEWPLTLQRGMFMARINTHLLRSLIQRKLFFMNKSIREASNKQWVIQPGETQYREPAIYSENNLARITSVGKDTTIGNEIYRISGGQTEHGPTIAYSLTSVELIDGRLYGRGLMHRLTDHKMRILTERKSEPYRDAVMACTYYGSIYFGHWMRDDLSLHLAAESVGRPVIAERKAYGHEADYCDLLGIQQRKLSRARFDQLIMLDDRGQNSYKRRRYQALRTRLGKFPSSGYEKVYIRRGINAGASRAIQNAEELEQFLIAQGFCIVDPDKLSSSEIVHATLGAKFVLGVEGSHMAHALYTLADEGTMCILQPPYRFNNVYKDYTDCLGLRYAFVIGVEVEGGFKVDIDDLKWLLDKLWP